MTTIISYRSRSSDSSIFLDVDKLAKSKNYKKIQKKYENIFYSVTAYDKEHAEALVKVENRLYQRMVLLNTDKKESLEGWKTIAFSVLTLGAFFLITKYKLKKINKAIEKIEQAHTKCVHALVQMSERKLEKDPQPKPEALKELEALRLDNPEEEHARLKAIPRIARSFGKIKESIKTLGDELKIQQAGYLAATFSTYLDPDGIVRSMKDTAEAVGACIARLQAFSINHEIALGRSLELQEKLKDTHYVFNHGQDLKAIIVNIVARKIKEEFESKHYESFEPLRHDAFLRKIQKEKDTPAFYQGVIGIGDITDHAFRTELISADCDLDSMVRAESALHFFATGGNIAAFFDTSIWNDLISTILQDYISNQDEAKKIAGDLVKIVEKCPAGSNLYSICVPKEKFDESCYFSRSYGLPFFPVQNEQFKEHIDDLQSGKIELIITPQIRVLSNKIRAEDGYYVVRNSTMAEDELKKLEDEVSLYLQAALAGYRIQGEDAKQLFR